VEIRNRITIKIKNMSDKKEIRYYSNKNIIKAFIGVMSLYPLTVTILSFYDKKFLEMIWSIILMWLLLVLFWVASVKGTYITVNKDTKKLGSSNFFIKMKEIPIESIIKIGTRGMYAGTASLIEVTYIDEKGNKKTLGYGTKNLLQDNLKKMLNTLVEINPQIDLSSDLK